MWKKLSSFDRNKKAKKRAPWAMSRNRSYLRGGHGGLCHLSWGQMEDQEVNRAIWDWCPLPGQPPSRGQVPAGAPRWPLP